MNEYYCLGMTAIYLLIFMVMAKYISMLTDKNFKLEKKYAELLFRAYLAEELRDLEKGKDNE